MFFPRVSLFLLFFIIFSINSFSSPRENWNYGKKGKEIKFWRNIQINPPTGRSKVVRFVSKTNSQRKPNKYAGRTLVNSM